MKLIYESIEESSNKIVSGEPALIMSIRAAKNYVCTPDLKHWTYGKTLWKAIGSSDDGGAAKQKLLSLYFENVLERATGDEVRTTIETAFLNWARKVSIFDIEARFNSSQRSNWRIELLVHRDVIADLPKTIQAEENQQRLFDEGYKDQIIAEVAKRDLRLVKLAKEHHGTQCLVCEMTFEDIYGEHGKGFIEVHHLNPMANGQRKSKVEDLRPVCSNCHRMLHKGDRLLSIEELKAIVNEQKKKN